MDSLWTSDSRACVAALFAASAADFALRICQIATAKPPRLTANAVTPTMKFAESIVEDCKRPFAERQRSSVRRRL